MLTRQDVIVSLIGYRGPAEIQALTAIRDERKRVRYCPSCRTLVAGESYCEDCEKYVVITFYGRWEDF